MMKLRIVIIGLLTIFTLGLLAANSAAAFNPFCTTDASGNCVSGPCQAQPNSPTCKQNAAQNGSTTNPAVHIIQTAANILATVGGIGAVIVIIISGFMFVTAGGGVGGQRSTDPSKAKNARAALTGAVIGLVIIALAWTIITFVTDKLVKT
jgi:hypothetical protein